MGLEKGGFERKDKEPILSDLHTVVENLRRESFEDGVNSIAQSPRGYRLNRSITPESLKELGSLSFESLIYDFKGQQLFLATGQRSGTLPDYREHEKELGKDPEGKWEDHYGASTSRFMLHSHPIRAVVGQMSGPSYQDIVAATWDYRHVEISFVVTMDGIFGYSGGEHLVQPNKYLGKLVNDAQRFNPDRMIEKQLKSGATDFFVPFEGDPGDRHKLELICQYMNDPSTHWQSIEKEIVGE